MRIYLLASCALAACAGLSSDPSHVEIVASGLKLPANLADGSDRIYFADSADSAPQALRALSKLDNSVAVVATGHVINGIAADASGVYWLDDDAGRASVWALPRAATAPVKLADNPNLYNGTSLRNMTIDAQAIYYADATGAVWRVAKTGGATQLGMTDTSAGSVALDATGVWVASLNGAKHLGFSGGTTQVTLPGLPDHLAWADGYLFASYFGSGGDDQPGSVVRVDPASATTTTLATLTAAGSLVAAGGALYVATSNANAAIHRMYETGDDAIVLTDNAKAPSDLVVDDRYVYWGDWADIRRVAR